MVPFTRQKILNTIPIDDIPGKEPSFSEIVNNTPARSQAFRELYSNLSDQAHESWIIEEAFGDILFSKYNIAPSSTTTKLYLFKGCSADKFDLAMAPFDIASIMCISIIQCMGMP